MCWTVFLCLAINCSHLFIACLSAISVQDSFWWKRCNILLHLVNWCIYHCLLLSAPLQLTDQEDNSLKRHTYCISHRCSSVKSKSQYQSHQSRSHWSKLFTCLCPAITYVKCIWQQTGDNVICHRLTHKIVIYSSLNSIIANDNINKRTEGPQGH